MSQLIFKFSEEEIIEYEVTKEELNTLFASFTGGKILPNKKTRESQLLNVIDLSTDVTFDTVKKIILSKNNYEHSVLGIMYEIMGEKVSISTPRSHRNMYANIRLFANRVREELENKENIYWKTTHKNKVKIFMSE